MPNEHALLSASSAHRWLNCPPSARLESTQTSISSEAAKEGTAAHALAEYKLKKALHKRAKRPKSVYDGREMEDCTDSYVECVLESYMTELAHKNRPTILIEQTLDLSNYVPEAFGTADAIIISNNKLHVFDFKYGKGITVDAEKNPQMMLYALGAAELYKGKYKIEEVEMTIFQPRRDNYSTWVTSLPYLKFWADFILAPAAKQAFEGEGEFKPGEWCIFCKISDTCRARAQEELSLLKHNLAEPPTLTNEEIAEILPKLSGLTGWANNIMSYAESCAISGYKFEGYKLVESRTNRKYTDEKSVIAAAKNAGYKRLFKKSLIPVTEMERLMGKRNFSEIIGPYIEKPKGKPTLVPDSDRRPEYEFSSAEAEFSKIKQEDI